MTGDPLDPDSDRTLDEGDSDLGQQLAQQRAAAPPRDSSSTAIRPAARVAPVSSSSSPSLPSARPAPAPPPVLPLPPVPGRRGGIVVHRASDAQPPPAAPPVVEALQALKPAAAAAMSSPPASSVSSLKPDVAEALAGLKPAAKTAASLTSLPPSTLPPSRVSSKVTAPPVSTSSSSSSSGEGAAEASTSTSTATPRVKSIAIPRWALQGAAIVALTCVTIGVGVAVRPEQDVAALPPVVALPELPITALHCDTLRAIDRTLECAFSPTMLASMTEAERTKRLQSTTRSALAMGYTRVVLVDRTGTWRVLRTDDAPVATMATALAEASQTPAPSSSPSSPTPAPAPGTTPTK